MHFSSSSFLESCLKLYLWSNGIFLSCILFKPFSPSSMCGVVGLCNWQLFLLGSETIPTIIWKSHWPTIILGVSKERWEKYQESRRASLDKFVGITCRWALHYCQLVKLQFLYFYSLRCVANITLHNTVYIWPYHFMTATEKSNFRHLLVDWLHFYSTIPPKISGQHT